MMHEFIAYVPWTRIAYVMGWLAGIAVLVSVPIGLALGWMLNAAERRERMQQKDKLQ
jgi:hypothetical protein